jgi:hypothetical protein
MKNYLGVDPGAQGAIALYSVPTLDGEIARLTLIDLRVDLGKGAQTFRKFSQIQLTMESVVAQLKMLLEVTGPIEFAVVETPASMPGEGVVSSFTFGKNCGLIEGILYALGIKVFQTVPAVWKSQLNLSSTKKKSILKAEELFKDVEIDGGIERFRKPVRIADGRAEAACLAWLAAHKMGGKF